MTIMSTSASRQTSGFTIQSILGETQSSSHDDETGNKKSKQDDSVSDSDSCNECSHNQTVIVKPEDRFHYGTYDAFSNDAFMQKLHFAHYGRILSQEYISRTHNDYRNLWSSIPVDGTSSFHLPYQVHGGLNSRNHLRSGANPEYLFSHLRKPKRVRTAFSPSQLLRLEHAFEKNHYVVGQERKELAAGLALTETQVKVWFQNRRTKHKRIKAEDEMTRSLARSLESRETEPLDESDSGSDLDV